jgi:phage terminase large subunit
MDNSQTQPSPNNAVTVHLTSKQSQAFRLLMDKEQAWLALMYGGAKGGGKDFLFCIWVKCFAEYLIQFLDLKPSPNPLPIGFIGRKRSIDMKSTTIEGWKRVIPPDHYRFHDDHREIILHETVKIHVGGLDDPKRVEKFNSAEYAFFALNQAEEMEREEVSVLRGALRLKFNGKQPIYRELYTANPADCWLKTDFVDEGTRQPGHVFVPALYTDNPHLPDNYAQTLESAFRYNQPLLNAYKFGDWHAIQALNTLITSNMLAELKGVIRHPKEIHRIVACDPSLGGDECPIGLIENGAVMEKKTLIGERDPMKIAGEIITIGNKWHTRCYAIDYSGGLGEAIASRIREVQPSARVFSLNSAEASSNEERWNNLRTEMWWSLMMKIQDKLIPYPEDEELRRQLSAVRFKVVNSNGKVALEPKDKTKERLKRSPDDADMFVYGNFKLGDTPAFNGASDRWNDDEYGRVEISMGAGSAMTA